MSVYTQEELQCPSCGHSQKVTLWSSLNTNLDPDAREALFSGEINVFVCDACGKRAFISTAFLYHDITLGFCVWYFPAKAMDQDGFFGQFTSDGGMAVDPAAAKLPRSASYLRRPHIVFDMGELVRYVRFREALAEAKRKAKKKG